MDEIHTIKEKWLYNEPLSYFEVLKLMEDYDFQVYLKMNGYIVPSKDVNGQIMNTKEYPHQVSLKY